MSLPDATSVIAPGRVLGGRYNLVTPLARGGMAEVWEALDEVLTRSVAVKLLQPHLAEDEVFVERFRREAITAARLSSPSIVATYDTGADSGTAYIVMELVRGRTLRALLSSSGPLDADLAVGIAMQIADALAHAHRAGLVHRDIKPANVLVCEDDGGARVKVTDFGIAKARAGAGHDLTQTGIVLGTPKYLSPEQVDGTTEPDTRSDLYSLGVVLFEMLTGRPPFNGRTDMATALAHLREQPPRVADLRLGVEPALDALVASLLAKSPADRPPTAVAARQALEMIRRRSGSRPGPALDLTTIGAIPRPRAADSTPRAGTSLGRATPATGSRPARGGTAPVPARPGSPPTGRVGAAAGRGSGAGTAPPPARTGPPPPRARGEGPATGSGPRRPPATRRRRRPGRVAGLTVAVVVIAAVVVAALLLGSPGRRDTGGGTPPPAAAPLVIRSVSVYMDNGRPPDNPGATRYAFDGNPSTAWSTDQYGNSTFGGLYDGEGLAIHLGSAGTVGRLVVDSPTKGWAARVYVSDQDVASGSPLAGWGQAVASRSAIDGSTTFDLGSSRGSWVMLWLTNLGPAHTASISELSVAS